MCKGKGTPGNSTTGRGKSGSSCNPRTLSLASLIVGWLREGIMADRRTAPQRGGKKFGPRIRVGQRTRGPSSTPSDEEGFIHGVWTDAKGSVRPDIKESARTAPTGERGSSGKCSTAYLQAQRVWRKSRLRLR